MSIIYRVHYMESERGWGQDYWYSDFASREEAQAAYDECNVRLEPRDAVGAPDFYIQANRIEVIDSELGSPASKATAQVAGDKSREEP